MGQCGIDVPAKISSHSIVLEKKLNPSATAIAMKKVAHLLLILALGLAGVASETQFPNQYHPSGGGARSQDHQKIVAALNSLKNIVSEYKNEIDTKVRLPELQKVINTLDVSMLDYQGRANSHLDQLRRQFSSARLSYQQCVDPIFEWCISINPTIDVFLDNVNISTISDSDRNILWALMANGLKNGLQKAHTSLSTLSQFENQTKDVAAVLARMYTDIEYDFANIENKLKSEISKLKSRGSKKDEWDAIIENIFRAIAELVRDPTLKRIFMYFTIDHWRYINEEKIASKEKEVEIINRFFEIMKQTLTNASSIAGQVKVGLDKEKSILEAVIPPRMVSGNIRQLELEVIIQKKLLFSLQDIVVVMGQEEVRHGLEPIFRDLNNVCTEYTTLRLSPSPSASSTGSPGRQQGRDGRNGQGSEGNGGLAGHGEQGTQGGNGGQGGDGGQGGNVVQPGHAGQPGTQGGQGGYGEQPEHGGQPRQTGYGGQPGYGGQTVYGGQTGYGGQPGHAGQTRYEGQRY